MPFVIPVKRTGVSHGVYMNKYVSEYRSMTKQKYFALQRKKSPMVSFGGIFSSNQGQDRPTYRIVTRGFGNHIYDIAYSDDLDDIRNNEWHYCIHELEKIMPKFDDVKTRRKWLVAHFTTLAINLGNTAENRYLPGQEKKVKDIDMRAKSEPHLQPTAPNGPQSMLTLPDLKLESKAGHSKGATPLSAPSDKKRISLSKTLTHQRGVGDRVLTTSTKRPWAKKVSRHLIKEQIDSGDDDLMHGYKPAPQSHRTLGYQQSSGSRGSIEDFIHNDDKVQSNESKLLHYHRSNQPLMLRVSGPVAFLLSTAVWLLFIVMARGSSDISFALLTLIIVTINFAITFSRTPVAIYLHVNVQELFMWSKQAKVPHQEIEQHHHHHHHHHHDVYGRHEDDDHHDELDDIGSRRGSIHHKGMLGVKDVDDHHLHDHHDHHIHSANSNTDESDDEEFVEVQINVLADPLENGDVVRLNMSVCGMQVKKDTKTSPSRRRGDSKRSSDTRSDSIAGVQRILSGQRGKIPAGISTAMRSRRKWEKIDPGSYKLRCGPNYKRNGYKKPSEGSYYDIIAVDAFHSNEKKHVSDIGNKVDLADLMKPEEVGWYKGLPRIWIVVLQIPAYAPSFVGSIQDGEGFAVVFYFKLNKTGLAAIDAGQGSSRVMRQFLDKPLDIADADRGAHQWKNMVRLANSEALQLGWVLQSYVTKYNAKPFLSRNCKSYYRGESYFEVDVDIHRFNYISRQGMYSFKDKLKELTLDIGFVVQCDTDDELPEKLLGCVRLKELDAQNDAVHLPLAKNDAKKLQVGERKRRGSSHV
uniref:Protein ENHANCED DISEASE RESISTANCE 2 C-terminal domain-containing protein n=1 Tax=Lotharella globosa TaxID=91324 RepID=A0A7S3Z124_9EUKA|mmetsp:Transcript_35625/g.68764  ORF Transcript_35625/g.68764 Transcript_35625/m.68764 type:complete len:806 (+) Transcript_35625:67-2484(+)